MSSNILVSVARLRVESFSNSSTRRAARASASLQQSRHIMEGICAVLLVPLPLCSTPSTAGQAQAIVCGQDGNGLIGPDWKLMDM